MTTSFPNLHSAPHHGSCAFLPLQVWCVPIDKMKRVFRWACSETREAARATSFLMAQQRAMDECGLLDVTIRVGCVFLHGWQKHHYSGNCLLDESDGQCNWPEFQSAQHALPLSMLKLYVPAGNSILV